MQQCSIGKLLRKDKTQNSLKKKNSIKRSKIPINNTSKAKSKVADLNKLFEINSGMRLLSKSITKPVKKFVENEKFKKSAKLISPLSLVGVQHGYKTPSPSRFQAFKFHKYDENQNADHSYSSKDSKSEEEKK